MGKSELISEKVYQSIKEKIMFGQYLPGVHLVEAELIEEYGVSRTTIRAALSRLMEDEIVQQVPHKGILVRKLSIKEVSDYYQICKTLEGMVARRVALDRTPEQLEELEVRLAAGEEAVRNLDFTQHFKNVQAFRHLLATYTDNQPLIRIIGKIHTILSVYHAAHPLKERVDLSYRKHHDLLEAIREQDGDLAESVMRSIIQTSLDMY